MLDSIEYAQIIQKLYTLYATDLFTYLRLYNTAREDAEDLLLEVFVAALEKKDFTILSEQQQRAWLFRVARNKTIDRYRHQARWHYVALDQVMEDLFEDDSLTPEQRALRQEEFAQLRSTVQQLSDQQQEVLHLRFTNELRCADIAIILGLRESSVRALLSRTLKHLRAIYKEGTNL
ncbi:RNA polymerase sigma factor [Dictyobacter arantiisoli]|uniref:DNA-directed RNA polymerase sigma-70 factor n=1 Tax=Dictyobacter arantiisoli TaxID=2014874 RepID=A0A5A5TL06_9CHLR|nr:sigma-70 family RNA polymerase sigma factor [Dictyobacter arantiisoli]GCF11796.1 DNA-directed RNA polymerase sigma-70 factor [Dictyobacter arantiisoli]